MSIIKTASEVWEEEVGGIYVVDNIYKFVSRSSNIYVAKKDENKIIEELKFSDFKLKYPVKIDHSGRQRTTEPKINKIEEEENSGID